PRRSDVEVICTAAVVDRRRVASSNGERENRYVISTLLSIGSRQWPIEVTLTNRDTMSYRMLLGRQAITEGILVDPGSSFCPPAPTPSSRRSPPPTPPTPATPKSETEPTPPTPPAPADPVQPARA